MQYQVVGSIDFDHITTYIPLIEANFSKSPEVLALVPCGAVGISIFYMLMCTFFCSSDRDRNMHMLWNLRLSLGRCKCIEHMPRNHWLGLGRSKCIGSAPLKIHERAEKESGVEGEGGMGGEGRDGGASLAGAGRPAASDSPCPASPGLKKLAVPCGEQNHLRSCRWRRCRRAAQLKQNFFFISIQQHHDGTVETVTITIGNKTHESVKL